MAAGVPRGHTYLRLAMHHGLLCKHGRSSSICACSELTSPMSDEANPSMASLPTKSSFVLVNPTFSGNSLPLMVGTWMLTAFLEVVPIVAVRVTACIDQPNLFS